MGISRGEIVISRGLFLTIEMELVEGEFRVLEKRSRAEIKLFDLVISVCKSLATKVDSRKGVCK